MSKPILANQAISSSSAPSEVLIKKPEITDRQKIAENALAMCVFTALMDAGESVYENRFYPSIFLTMAVKAFLCAAISETAYYTSKAAITKFRPSTNSEDKNFTSRGVSTAAAYIAYKTLISSSHAFHHAIHLGLFRMPKEIRLHLFPYVNHKIHTLFSLKLSFILN